MINWLYALYLTLAVLVTLIGLIGMNRRMKHFGAVYCTGMVFTIIFILERLLLR